MDGAEEIAAIEAALKTLLSAIKEQQIKTPSRSPVAPVFSDASSLSPVDDLINDPIGYSFRLGIRRLGKRLSELDRGGSELMSEALNRVCGNNQDWADILDKRWDGIGGWMA